ncbi:NAD(P)/FAD-dependent oxidoreductase [Actinokineospora fastidiosa]|uniref:Glycerol-3-phosphate dehydrogenase n=1 Tax=Actinokineospora fastidiosa TaxID=1816 RepID=A0A918LFP1_9PSEU|nr:FAD-dependent oxidoreductase [Actinokineospora fastidiosa]GGS41032.1 glycerol-3-phosphate dehydrogenase [Actinokineospora fastidiosa]
MAWDVLVVGGGIAGVSVAAELAARGSVLLAEAEPELARHTTGRSAAICVPSYGGPLVRALTAASRFPDGLLTPRAMLWVTTDGPSPGRPGARPISLEQAREVCPALRPGAIAAADLDERTADIDAMGLHQHYVRALRAHGGEIRRGAPVTALRRDGAGWRAAVGADEVRAGLVVAAAGAWTDRVAALAGVPPLGLRPLHRTIAIAAGRPVEPDWPLVVDTADRFYFRPESGALLVSPADETPSEPVDAKPDDLDVALAVERVNAVTTLGLRTVRTAWAGLRTFAPDRDPVVGVRDGHPGFAFFAGQGGHGIQLAPALAATGAAIIAGDDPGDGLAAALSPDRFP